MREEKKKGPLLLTYFASCAFGESFSLIDLSLGKAPLVPPKPLNQQHLGKIFIQDDGP